MSLRLRPEIRRALFTSMGFPFLARSVLYLTFILAIALLGLLWTDGRQREFKLLAEAHARGYELSHRADCRVRCPYISSASHAHLLGFLIEAERERNLHLIYADAAREPWKPIW